MQVSHHKLPLCKTHGMETRSLTNGLFFIESTQTGLIFRMINVLFGLRSPHCTIRFHSKNREFSAAIENISLYTAPFDHSNSKSLPRSEMYIYSTTSLCGSESYFSPEGTISNWRRGQAEIKQHAGEASTVVQMQMRC